MDEIKCGTVCDQDPKCVGFVTYQNNCWLKSSMKQPFNPSGASGVNSYIKETGYTLEKGIDYAGNDIKMLSDQDANSCAATCDSEPGCIGYVMHAGANNCWLKSKMDKSNYYEPAYSYTKQNSASVGGLVLRAGLKYVVYSGYFNDDLTFFDTAKLFPVYEGSVYKNVGYANTIENLYFGTSALKNAGWGGWDKPGQKYGIHSFSVEWTGYFKPDVDGDYEFHIASDDAVYIWIGELAKTANKNRDLATLKTPGIHGMVEDKATIKMSSSIYYPICIRYGSWGGGQDIKFYWFKPGDRSRTPVYGGPNVFYHDEADNTVTGQNIKTDSKGQGDYIKLIDDSEVAVTRNNVIRSGFTIDPFFEVEFDFYFESQTPNWTNLLFISPDYGTRSFAIWMTPSGWVGPSLHIRHSIQNNWNWGIDAAFNPDGSNLIPNKWQHWRVRLDKMDDVATMKAYIDEKECKTNNSPKNFPEYSISQNPPVIYENCFVILGFQADPIPGSKIKNFKYRPIYYDL